MIRKFVARTFMRCNSFRLFYGVCLVAILSVSGAAQKGGQGPAAAGQQSAQASQGAVGGQGLQGLSYSPDEWTNLRLPDVKGPNWTFKEGRAVVCYRLVKGNSATPPFILEPISRSEVIGSGFYRPCGDESQGDRQRRTKICKQAGSGGKEIGAGSDPLESVLRA